ncbi:hypothetical protein CAPTEDRAFT_151369 [Capitella teleta]|uniref:Uroporphyrinogen decarboxylase n=1 Tax=Capitella teleta TaxID=283909 RepID=R7U935_CAPTE|nr:hypothetical protein CAPTEDRAFT_151369 [Capitella teleta]|eukprot:ELU00207.1 hypothetical protein CAPTEDRAFT_151369 [Capitella teleta]
MTSNKNFPALKNDLILRAARGEPVSRVPVWVKRQAGRYLPEYRKVSAEHGFLKICKTPELACEVTLQPLRRFDMDASIIFSDILVVPEAMGMNLTNTDSGPGYSNRLESPSDIERVHDDIDIEETLGYVLQAITLTRHKINGQCPLLGFCGAPWTLMCYMVEGKGSVTHMKARRWLYAHSADSHRLLQKITDVLVRYLIAQVEAGAQMLQLFEAHAGIMTQEQFREFALPYYKQILNRVKQGLKAKGLSVPMNVFAKDAHYALPDLSNSGFDVVSLDWTMNPSAARQVTANKVTLQGNLDPCALYADTETISAKVKDMLAQFGTGRYIANLGHGIYLDTNPDHLKAFVDAVHKHSENMLSAQE